MASSQSSVYTYDNINLFKQENLGLLAQQMQLKQGAVDQNKMMIESLQRKIGIELDVAKEEDQKYIYERLSQAQGLINGRLRGADMSDLTVGANLVRQLKETVNDKNIMNAVSSTAKGRALVSHIESIKESDPDLYNERNAAVATEGWQKYLQTDGIGNVYNGGEYTPYTDLDKRFTSDKVNKALKDSGLTGYEWIQEAGSNGYFGQVKGYKGTPDPARLSQFVDAYMGEDGKKQLAIDARYKYGDGSSELGVQLFRERYNTRVNDEKNRNNNTISSITKMLETKQTPERRDQLIQQRDTLRKDNQNIKGFDSIVTDDNGVINQSKFIGLTAGLEISTAMNKYTSLLYQKPELTDIDVNKFEYKTKQYEQGLMEFKWKQKVDRESAQLARDRLDFDKTKEILSSSGKLKLDKDGKLVSSEEGDNITNMFSTSEMENFSGMSDKDKGDYFTTVVDERAQATDNLKAIVSASGFELGEGELTNLALNPQDYISTDSEGDVLTFTDSKGKQTKIRIDANVNKAIDTYRKTSQGNSEYYKNVKEAGLVANGEIVNSVVKNYNLADLGNKREANEVMANMKSFRIKKVTDTNGKPTFKLVYDEVGQNSFIDILKRAEGDTSKLKEEDLATLKLMAAINTTMYQDKTNENSGRLMFNGVQDYIIGKFETGDNTGGASILNEIGGFEKVKNEKTFNTRPTNISRMQLARDVIDKTATPSGNAFVDIQTGIGRGILKTLTHAVEWGTAESIGEKLAGNMNKNVSLFAIYGTGEVEKTDNKITESISNLNQNILVAQDKDFVIHKGHPQYNNLATKFGGDAQDGADLFVEKIEGDDNNVLVGYYGQQTVTDKTNKDVTVSLNERTKIYNKKFGAPRHISKSELPEFNFNPSKSVIYSSNQTNPNTLELGGSKKINSPEVRSNLGVDDKFDILNTQLEESFSGEELKLKKEQLNSIKQSFNKGGIEFILSPEVASDGAVKGSNYSVFAMDYENGIKTPVYNTNTPVLGEEKMNEIYNSMNPKGTLARTIIYAKNVLGLK